MRYTDSELNTLLNDPREVSDRPYLLFTSYALNAIRDLTIGNDDDEDTIFPDDLEMWGHTVPINVLDRFIRELVEDFTCGTSVTIAGMKYTIRKAATVDKERLYKVFSFRKDGDDYVIERNGVININGDSDDSFERTRNEMTENREYLRKIIFVAEDDEHNGWEKLTDMEAAAYCWALFWHKNQSNDVDRFQKKYKSWHALSDRELVKGWSRKCQVSGLPNGMYTFSAKNIMKWNEDNGQKSVVGKVTNKQADDYWYDTATQNTFK